MQPLFTTVDYFELISEYKFLTHTWSLYLDTVEHILAALCSQLTYLQRDNVFKALHLNIHNVLPEAAKGILDVEVHEESTRGNRPPLFGPKLIKKLEERGGSDLVSKLKRLRTPAKDTRGASSGQRRIEGGPPSKRLRADRQERQPAPRTTYESRASGRGSKPTKGNGSFEVMVIGNSYVQNYQNYAEKPFKKRYARFHMLGRGMCTPFVNYDLMPLSALNQPLGKGCEEYNKYLFEKVETIRPTILLMNFGLGLPNQLARDHWDEMLPTARERIWRLRNATEVLLITSPMYYLSDKRAHNYIRLSHKVFPPRNETMYLYKVSS
ncbi:unnamed protein product, partial [Mesorhabditis belari]|uniref:Uncharacterized protein n=1 Tax=Mesorhabditis belari TaxID=2138241 RepID=A0AAF3EC94_9BILA